MNEIVALSLSFKCAPAKNIHHLGKPGGPPIPCESPTRIREEDHSPCGTTWCASKIVAFSVNVKAHPQILCARQTYTREVEHPRCVITWCTSQIVTDIVAWCVRVSQSCDAVIASGARVWPRTAEPHEKKDKRLTRECRPARRDPSRRYEPPHPSQSSETLNYTDRTYP